VTSFDPRHLTLTRGVPVSSVLPPGVDPRGDPERGGGWYPLGEGWHAVANAMFGTDEDPGLFAFVWVRWPGVVDLVLRHASPLDRTGPAWPEPDPTLVGFAPLTWKAALRHEKADGGRPMHSASYRMTDGAYSYSKLSSASRDYFFAPANPEDDDEAIGVLFRLPA
jgi:hypothetical protein